MNDYHAYKCTSGKSGGSSNRGRGKELGCGWIIIVIVVIMLIFSSQMAQAGTQLTACWASGSSRSCVQEQYLDDYYDTWKVILTINTFLQNSCEFAQLP